MYPQDFLSDYFKYRNKWNNEIISSEKPYRIFNTVVFKNEVYVAIVDYPTNPPSDTNQWTKIGNIN